MVLIPQPPLCHVSSDSIVRNLNRRKSQHAPRNFFSFTIILLTGCSSDTALPGTLLPDVTTNGPSPGPTGEDPQQIIDPPNDSGSTHQVDFMITVPPYQSDTLQVLLAIGDERFEAVRELDGTWTVSVDLPSDSQISPTVFFFDRNGAVLLAWTRDQSLQINTGPLETIRFPEFLSQSSYVYADTDLDGTTNIDELTSGTDHEVSEGSIIAETSEVPNMSLDNMFALSERYETLIPQARPYILDVVDPNRVVITLDVEGNGSYSSSERELDGDRSVITRTGTRSVGDLGVSWEGRFSRVNPERQEEADFSSQTTRYSNSTYGQVGQQSVIIGGNNPSAGEYSYSVVGDRYGDDGSCSVQYGQITSMDNYGSQTSGTTTGLGSPQRYTISGTSSPDSPELGWRFKRELRGVVLENFRVLNVDSTFYCNFGGL